MDRFEMIYLSTYRWHIHKRDREEGGGVFTIIKILEYGFKNCT